MPPVDWITVTCPTCGGNGRRGNGPCGLCEGKGRIQVPPLEDTDDY